MSFATMRTFFALLALGANLAVVGYLVLVAAGPRAAAVSDRVRATLDGYELPFAWVAAATATFGSLYLSEIVNLIPCTYCWYQRIAMYPLVVILGIAWWRRDRGVVRYAAPLATIGLAIAGWHYLIQQVPSLGGDACTVGVPCNSAYFWEFGFISIPYMAGSAFALILALLHVLTTNRRSDPASLDPPSHELV